MSISMNRELVLIDHEQYATTPNIDSIRDEWEIPIRRIVREEFLGEGTFGQVAKGFIRGPIPGNITMNNRLHATVALKCLKSM